MKFHIGSQYIQVFPSVDRTLYESTKLTEARLAKFTNQLIGFKYNNETLDKTFGFVYPNGYTNIQGGPFEFNILGYKFEISEISEITNKFFSSEEIWAYISILSLDTIEDNPDYRVLHILDDDEVFKGLTFSDRKPQNGFGLKILEKNNSNFWVVPTNSYNIINRIPSFIDGGEIGTGEQETYFISYSLLNCSILGEKPLYIKRKQTVSFQVLVADGSIIQDFRAVNANISVSADKKRFTLSNASGDVEVYINAQSETYTIHIGGENCIIHATGSVSGALEDGDTIYQGETIQWTAEPFHGYRIDGPTSGTVEVNHNDVSIDISTYAIYEVKNNLVYCENSNTATFVLPNNPYQGIITSFYGYLIKSIPAGLILMDGWDVTEQFASINNYCITISIGAVTGDLIINAGALKEASLSVFPNNLFNTQERYCVGERNAKIILNPMPGAVIPDTITQENIIGATLINYIKHEDSIELYLDIIDNSVLIVAGKALTIKTGGFATVEPNISMVPCDKDEITFSVNAVTGYALLDAVAENNCCRAELFFINEDDARLRLSDFRSDTLSITIKTEKIIRKYTISCVGGIYGTMTPEYTEVQEGESCLLTYTLADNVIAGTESFNVIPAAADVQVNKSTHTILISNISQNISITMAATIGDYVQISYGAPNEHWYVVGTPISKVLRGEDISIRVGVDEGLYKRLTKDDFYLGSGSEASIESLQDGLLTIKNIQSDISIHANVHERDYTVTWVGTNIVPESSSWTVTKQESISVAYQINEGYIAGVPYVIPLGAATLDFSTSGIVLISNIISDCYVYYKAEEKPLYAITYNLSGCTLIGSAPRTISEGESCSIYVSTNSGYKTLTQDKISVTNASFEYMNGNLTISNATGNVTVKIQAEEIVYTIMIVADTHISFEKTEVLWYMAHSSVERLNYSLEQQYHLSQSSVTYDSSKCTVLVRDDCFEIKNVLGDAIITVECVSDSQPITLSVSGTNCSPDKEQLIKNYGGFANIAFVADENYNLLYGNLILDSVPFTFEDYIYHKGLPDMEIRTKPIKYNGMEFQLVDISEDFTQAILYISNISDDTDIQFSAAQNVEYSVTVNLNNCYLEETPPTAIKSNETIHLVLKSNEWYSLDDATIEEKIN